MKFSSTILFQPKGMVGKADQYTMSLTFTSMLLLYDLYLYVLGHRLCLLAAGFLGDIQQELNPTPMVVLEITGETME